MSDSMKVIVKINTHVNEVEVMGPTSRAAATITAMDKTDTWKILSELRVNRVSLPPLLGRVEKCNIYSRRDCFR